MQHGVIPALDAGIPPHEIARSSRAMTRGPVVAQGIVAPREARSGVAVVERSRNHQNGRMERG